MLELKDIVFGYRRSDRVFNGACFTACPGETALINGESGSGKTTLLYLIGGLLRPDSGEITFEGRMTGRTTAQLSSFRKRNVGFILQKYVLINEKTVLENVILPLFDSCGASEARERGFALLESLKIEELAHRRPYEISSGQQQRAAFARAVIASPPLLLADEPTAALDPENSGMIMDLLTGYAEAGNIVVICTHDRPELGSKAVRWEIKDRLLRRT